MASVHVPLGGRAYDINIGGALLPGLGRACQRLGFAGRCAVITDATVEKLHSKAVLQSLDAAGFQPVLVTITAGEKSKSLATVARCYDAFARHRLERKSFVVALGGGVVGDLAGFVAASYLRGIPFVQVPTTLLAQVDSSVGGKVGINLRAGKNLVGAFHQPRLVLCDLDTLATLPEREFAAGLAEVIKYGVIHDAALFAKLERVMPKLLARDAATLASVIARCCGIKADVVGQDETESGLRAILNFGHTIGHAIEAISGYGKFLHGEAISIGMVAAAHLSARLEGFPETDAQRLRTLLAAAGLPVDIRLNASQRARLLAATRLDKKVSAGEVKFVLAKRLGEVHWGQKVPEPLIHEALDAVAPSTIHHSPSTR